MIFQITIYRWIVLFCDNGGLLISLAPAVMTPGVGGADVGLREGTLYSVFRRWTQRALGSRGEQARGIAGDEPELTTRCRNALFTSGLK